MFRWDSQILHRWSVRVYKWFLNGLHRDIELPSLFFLIRIIRYCIFIFIYLYIYMYCIFILRFVKTWTGIRRPCCSVWGRQIPRPRGSATYPVLTRCGTSQRLPTPPCRFLVSRVCALMGVLVVPGSNGAPLFVRAVWPLTRCSSHSSSLLVVVVVV